MWEVVFTTSHFIVKTMEDNMNLVEILEIEKSYEDTLACSNINIKVKEGEFFTLLGPSGCGKTTLLRLIAGFIFPDKGKIYLAEKDITNTAIENRNIGMVFQNYALFPHMNVYENIEYGLKIKKFSKKEISERVSKYLDLVNLKGYEKRKISELSGGEQQRVALARALVIEPKVLLLDEPLSNLDAKLKEKMRNELKTIQKKLGITTIFVTHDQQEALTISDRIAVFNKGKCLQVGTPNEIYLNPVNKFVATFVGENNLFEKSNFPFEIEDRNLSKYITVRPQDINMNKDNITKNTGIIKSVNVIGALIEYTVSLNSHLIKVVALNSFDQTDKYNVCDKVYLDIDFNKIKTFNS